ncbi:PAS domain S-box protein [Nitrospira sp. Nam74]
MQSTKLTRTEDFPRYGEEQFHMMTELIPDIVFTTCPDGSDDYLNQRFFEYTGLEPEEGAAASWLHAVHPEDVHLAQNAWPREKEALTSHEITLRLRGKDGSYRWFITRTRPVRDRADHILKWVGTVTDVHDLKVAKAALREREEEYRAMFELASVGKAQVDPYTGRYVRVNHKLSEMTGYSPEELMSKTIGEITHPEDRQHDSDALKQLMSGELQEYSTEKRYIRKDGSVRWAHLDAVMLRDSQGMPLRAVGVIQDITERKRAEEALRESEDRFKAFMDNTPAVAFMKDEEGRYVYANRMFTSLFQMQHKDLVGQSDADVFPSEAARQLQANDAAILKTNTPQQVLEQLPAPDGVLRHWLTFKFPVEASHRRLLGGVAFDVTDRVQAETALQESKRQLQTLNETLEEMVKARTIELLNKQQTLRALAAELTRTEARERKRLATDLHDNLAQLLVLCKMKLEVAEHNRMDPASAFKAVTSLLDEALIYTRTVMSDLRPPLLGNEDDLRTAIAWVVEKLQRHGLTVTVYDDGQPKLMDEDVLTVTYQAIHELLFNVLKHARTKQAIVLLKRDKEYLEAVVMDEGAGFVPGTQPSTLDEGGFGLFSIRERIEPLGGCFTITSHMGVGTTAKLIMPLKICTNSPDMSELTPRGQSPGSSDEDASRTVAASKIRVLLVDDHQIIREGLRSIIEGQDDLHVVAEAADGKEALDLSRKLRPDIIVMDVNLPVLNGPEATRLIKAEFPTIAIIGLSVHEESKMAQTMRDAGASDYLSKGGSFERLCHAIRSAASKGTHEKPSRHDTAKTFSQ